MCADPGSNGGGEPRTPQQDYELRAAIFRHDLDYTAKQLLYSVTFRAAMRILSDLEAKSFTVRNPIAFVIKAARRVVQKEQEHRERCFREGKGAQPEADVVDIAEHYEALELDDGVDETAIKRAYRKLVLRWHPDKNPSSRDEAEERIRSINEAYEVLSNPAKRSAYDQQRRAVEKRRKTGARVSRTVCVKTDLPRESMLQPVGYPDKFVRYLNRGRGPECIVQSRMEAKRKGSDVTLEDFLPFFKPTKLSFWWLPEGNDMCRIRAVEISTDVFFGTPIKAGQAGGLNLAFNVLDSESDVDSAVKLMEARRGEKKEHVNFSVLPSPIYEGAFRFEAAYRKGWLLGFRSPEGLRMVQHVEGRICNVIVDFSAIDFAHMFKFIEIEEVLKPAMQGSTGWVHLNLLKTHADVKAYFRDILGRPVWDDDDFQTYFDGHFDTWEYRPQDQSVRLRKQEERLGMELMTAATPDQVAQVVAGAAHDALTKLPLAGARHALQAMSRAGLGEIATVVTSMEAKRKLVKALGEIFRSHGAYGARPTSLSEVVGLAHEVHLVQGDPSLVRIRSEVVDVLELEIYMQIDAAEVTRRPVPLELDELAALAMLPSAMAKGDLLVRLMAPRLPTAPLRELVLVIEGAAKGGVAQMAKAAGAAALAALAAAPLEEACAAIRALLKAGIADGDCAVLLPNYAASMSTADLAACVAALAERCADIPALPAAAALLALRGSLAAAPEVLLSLAVSATKTEAVAGVVAGVAAAATAALQLFSLADLIRLLLAVSKAKGKGVPAPLRSALFGRAAEILKPRLSDFTIVELIKVGLACGGVTSGSGEAAGVLELLEAAGAEAERRLPDVQPAQLLLLTQALVPLGGRHSAVQRAAERWAEVLVLGGASCSLDAEQLAKLAQVLAPVMPVMEQDARERCLAVLGAKLVGVFAKLTPQSRQALGKQAQGEDGLGLWRDRRQLLALLPEEAGQREKRRSRSREKRRSRSRERKRSRSRGRDRDRDRDKDRRR